MKKLKLTAKRSRREGIPLSDAASHARALARRPFAPGQHGPTSRTRLSDYGKQLREKQKAKRLYGLNERQFSNLFAEMTRKRGNTGEMLVRVLESRLDNVVYRAGFAKTRPAARQSVSHAHFNVNGKKTNVPSFRVKVGDVISLRDNKREKKALWKDVEEVLAKKDMPSWIVVDSKAASAKITGAPTETELKTVPFDPKQIVEFYSR